MFIGFLLFVLVFLMAFWLMVFLMGFLPFWIGAYFIDLFNGDKVATEQEDS
jgi:hypothetical protein